MRLGHLLVVLGLGCSSDPVDVVIIAVDTLRVDHVSAYAPEGPAKTPHMDSLAKDGVIHTQAFSPVSVTAPAFASLMTGQQPGQHGVLMNMFRGGAPLPASAQTLAEQFAAAPGNYATGGFVSAYTLRRQVGLGQGFQVYNGGERANRWGEQTFTTALRWMKNHADQPIFMWVHSYDPHGPVRRFSKPADAQRVWNNDPSNTVHLPKYQRDAEITDPDFYREMYVRGVEYADSQVGRLLNALKAQGRYDDALVILLADHGETLTERPLWFDHGTSAHVEQLQIPLIIKYPKKKRAGSHDDRLVSLVDVAPTILETAGLPALPDPAGRALMHSGVIHTSLVGESSHCKEVEILACAPKGGLGKELAIRSLERTAVYKSNGPQTTWESYNRTTDPHERTPETLGPEGPLRAPLEALQVDRKARVYADPPGISAPASKETQKLRSLGYIE